MSKDIWSAMADILNSESCARAKPPRAVRRSTGAAFIAEHGDICVGLDALPLDVLRARIVGEVEGSRRFQNRTTCPLGGPGRRTVDKKEKRKVVDHPVTIVYTDRVMKELPTITEALKSAVRNSGLSLYRISKESGLNEDSLSRFMRGAHSLILSKADKLASYLEFECHSKKRTTNQPK